MMLRSSPRVRPLSTVRMWVSASVIFAMLRCTITCGRPLVRESVSMYCCGDCVWPLSPSGSVPLRKISPAFAADLDELVAR